MMKIDRAQLAILLGVSDDTLYRLKRSGVLKGEQHGKRERYDIEEVREQIAAFEASKADRLRTRATELRCCRCKQSLPRDRFMTITVMDKRCRPGHSWTGPSVDCRECRNKYKRDLRRKDAARNGRQFFSRDELRALKLVKKQESLVSRQKIREEQQARKNSPHLRCAKCRSLKDRREFHPSESTYCKECVRERDAADFRASKEALSDEYVKRRIANATGLRWSDIPAALVQAKRAHLMIQRIVNPKRRQA
jgi:hypothetical protein